MVGVVERLAGRALLGESEAKAAGLRAETVDLWRLFQRGAYYDVLASPLGRKLLREGGERESAAGCETREEEGKGARGEDRAGALVAEVDPDTASDRARTLLRSSPSAETAAAVSWVGAAALCRFVQANWTSGGGRKGGEAVLRALSVDGEAPYILLASPELLLVARALLIEPLAELVATAQDGTNKSPDSPQGSLVAASANWWAARTAMVHQWCLSGTAPKLEAVISKCMRAASDALEASASAEGAMLGARVMVIDLAARPELNGLIGVAGRWDAERGRYAFKSEAGGDGLWLKPDNLLRVATEAGQVAGESDAGGEGDGGMVVRLRALARLESVQQLLTHRKHAQAVAQLQLACSTLGISLSTSGALGRRTRHQQTATAQLTMQVAFAPHAAPRPARLTPGDVMAAAAAAELPKRVDAEDDTLLDEVQLEDDEAGGQGACGPALWPVEQMAVLAQAAVVRSGSAAHSTTVEQAEPYLRSVLSSPRTWAAGAKALLLRSRADASRSRRRHVALMQLEELYADASNARWPTDGLIGLDAAAAAASSRGAVRGGGTFVPTRVAYEADRLASIRLRGFWASGLESNWQLGTELARSLAALGMFTQASTMFGTMQLWDEYVECLIQLGERSKAEEVVRERLDVQPTPTLWCYLGDLDGDEGHYRTAWDLSKGSCARAKLALGAAAMRREAWEVAREELRAALAVKAHLAEAWYCCAVCALKMEREVEAITDLRRVVAIDQEHYQAWASLGGLFAKQKQPREALCAFREACRLRGESSALWRSAAALAADLKLYSEAAFRARRCLETGGAPDAAISAVLADAVVKDVRAADSTSARRILPQLRTLLDIHTKMEPEQPTHWQTFLYVEKACGTPRDRLPLFEGHLAALKSSLKWTQDSQALASVSEAAAQLVEAKLDAGCEPDVLRALSKEIGALLHGAEDKLGATEGAEGLRMVMTRLTRHLDDVD